MITIEVNYSGKTEKKMIKANAFGAMEGWDLQRRFIDFRSSKDPDERKAFTAEVLGYASVLIGDQELALSSTALIENHLVTWQNIKIVFEEVLRKNGIDPENHGDRPEYWAEAGGMLAFSFLTNCGNFIKPMIDRMGAEKEG